MHFHYSPISLLSFSGISFQTLMTNIKFFKVTCTPTNILPYEYIPGQVSPATLSITLKEMKIAQSTKHDNLFLSFEIFLVRIMPFLHNFVCY